MSSFVPTDFCVPQQLTTDEFHLQPLAESHAEMDYAAVMETQQRLAATSPNGWPRDGFTLAENIADLRRHEEEFAQRIAFAYTVLSPAGDRVLGCVYFNPSEMADTVDADVYMWVRESEYASGLALRLYDSVRKWLEQDWSFENINYTRTEYYRE